MKFKKKKLLLLLLLQTDLGYNVSVNSKPDNSPPPTQNPRAIFLMGEFPTPRAKKEFKTPIPRAYKNELKLHPRGHFP